MQFILSIMHDFLSKIALPVMGWADVLEIILLSYFIYKFILWIRTTRAYSLLKGILFVAGFVFIVYILQMNTILWIVRTLANVLIIGLIIIFQPELRKVLEQLGQKQFMASLNLFDTGQEVEERFSDKTVNELVKACYEMAEVKTGALIVVEQNVSLADYERTGIMVDAILTSQLLINIFEHNTPLHDGAVIVRGNRVTAATCYLPLSDNMSLSKTLGTRHRAGVGISEVTDSLTIIVSEETGRVSVAQKGVLSTNVSSAQLRETLDQARNRKVVENKFRQFLKGRRKNEKKAD